VTRSIEPSEETVLVLASLLGIPTHGRALLSDVDEHTGKRLGPRTLYGIVAPLEGPGYVCRLEIGDRGRSPYRTISAGKRAYEEGLQHLQRYGRALRALSAS
jgi:DNA-binding PadR family transcriptional regulator